MTTSVGSRFLLLVLACAAITGAAACGGASSDATGTSPGDGQQIFADAGCGGCHTFAPANATGTSGPSLDGTSLSVEAVAEQVKNGGGGMPSFGGDLTPEQIDAVSAFVVDAGSTN